MTIHDQQVGRCRRSLHGRCNRFLPRSHTRPQRRLDLPLDRRNQHPQPRIISGPGTSNEGTRERGPKVNVDVSEDWEYAQPT